MSDTQQDDSERNRDPGQITAPYVDTNYNVWRFVGLNDWALFVPALLAVIAALVSVFITSLWVTFAMLVVAVALVFVALIVIVTGQRWESPSDRLRQRIDNWHQSWTAEPNDSLADVSDVAGVSEWR